LATARTNALPAEGGLNYSTFFSAIVSIGFAGLKYFAPRAKKLLG
jgi:hypothetical protein